MKTYEHSSTVQVSCAEYGIKVDRAGQESQIFKEFQVRPITPPDGGGWELVSVVPLPSDDASKMNVQMFWRRRTGQRLPSKTW